MQQNRIKRIGQRIAGINHRLVPCFNFTFLFSARHSWFFYYVLVLIIVWFVTFKAELQHEKQQNVPLFPKDKKQQDFFLFYFHFLKAIVIPRFLLVEWQLSDTEGLNQAALLFSFWRTFRDICSISNTFWEKSNLAAEHTNTLTEGKKKNVSGWFPHLTEDTRF